MSATKGYYSVIQFCPDRSRMESANIGVLLLCPELRFVKARTAAGNDRISRFFRGQTIDKVRVNAAKRSIERRVEVDCDNFRTPEDIVRFMETRGNDIMLTPPRPVKVVSPEDDLVALFTELVGGRARRETRKAEIPALEAVFRRRSLKNRVLFDHQIVIPVLGRQLRVPYAYRNGVLNLVKPQRFVADEGRTTSIAMRLASEGQLLYRHAEEEKRKLVVVSAFDPDVAKTDLPTRVHNVLREFQVHVVPEDEIDAFAQQIESQAH